jgi:hypothetical protein
MERCSICGCRVHRSGEYAKPTVRGRSHATNHHYVAERFFGRSKNRPGTARERVFVTCPWGSEGLTATYCYECHEELIHNPVFTPKDIQALARLVAFRNLSEDEKPEGREKLAGRIQLLHEIIEAGLKGLAQEKADSGYRSSPRSANKPGQQERPEVARGAAEPMKRRVRLRKGGDCHQAVRVRPQTMSPTKLPSSRERKAPSMVARSRNGTPCRKDLVANQTRTMRSRTLSTWTFPAAI